MESVLAVNFAQDPNAYEALTTLKTLDDQGQVSLKGAAVVLRDESGKIDIKDEVGDTGYEGTATGGIIGLIIGILGGPFGVLLGGATGLLIGSLFDLDDADETESVLGELSRSVRVGHDALVAEVEEQSPEVIDSAMERLGGTVVRRSLDDVEAEIAAAEEAQREAKREARQALRKARREKDRDEIHAKVENLKGKLHRNKDRAAVSA
jgi:uncharacterized membrane protein